MVSQECAGHGWDSQKQEQVPLYLSTGWLRSHFHPSCARPGRGPTANCVSLSRHFSPYAPRGIALTAVSLVQRSSVRSALQPATGNRLLVLVATHWQSHSGSEPHVPAVGNPRQDRSWTPIRRFPPILSSSLCPHRVPARRLPSHESRDTGRAAAGRARPVRSTPERTYPFFPSR
jgi:hypothetical protein